MTTIFDNPDNPTSPSEPFSPASISPITPCTFAPPALSNDQAVVRESPTMKFEADCVIVHTDPLAVTEDGVRRKLSLPSMSRRGAKDCAHSQSGTRESEGTARPSIRRRLSLTLAPIINITSPSTKIRLLPRRWSGSSPPSLTLSNKSQYRTPQAKSQPAPPIMTPSPVRVATKNASSVAIPSTSEQDALDPSFSHSMESTVLVDFEPCGSAISMSQETEQDEFSRPTQDRGSPSKPQDVGDVAVNDREIHRLSSASSLTAVDDSDETTQSLPSTPTPAPTPTQRPVLHVTPPDGVLTRRPTYLSRNTSIAEDLAVLSEVDESIDHHDHSEIAKDVAQSTANGPSISSSISPSSASHSGVWLCSPPPRSPTSPALGRQESRTSIASLASLASSPPPVKKHRPLVIRSMSTGRLASEFDEHGRILCLSTHSERVLFGSPEPVRPGPSCWNACRTKTPASTPARSFRPPSTPTTATAPISPAKSAARNTLPRRATSHVEKQISQGTLRSSPTTSSVFTGALTRTMSSGSWKKRGQWFVGSRSVRV